MFAPLIRAPAPRYPTTGAAAVVTTVTAVAAVTAVAPAGQAPAAPPCSSSPSEIAASARISDAFLHRGRRQHTCRRARRVK